MAPRKRKAGQQHAEDTHDAAADGRRKRQKTAAASKQPIAKKSQAIPAQALRRSSRLAEKKAKEEAEENPEPEAKDAPENNDTQDGNATQEDNTAIDGNATPEGNATPNSAADTGSQTSLLTVAGGKTGFAAGKQQFTPPRSAKKRKDHASFAGTDASPVVATASAGVEAGDIPSADGRDEQKRSLGAAAAVQSSPPATADVLREGQNASSGNRNEQEGSPNVAAQSSPLAVQDALQDEGQDANAPRPYIFTMLQDNAAYTRGPARIVWTRLEDTKEVGACLVLTPELSREFRDAIRVNRNVRMQEIEAERQRGRINRQDEKLTKEIARKNAESADLDFRYREGRVAQATYNDQRATLDYELRDLRDEQDRQQRELDNLQRTLDETVDWARPRISSALRMLDDVFVQSRLVEAPEVPNEESNEGSNVDQDDVQQPGEAEPNRELARSDGNAQPLSRSRPLGQEAPWESSHEGGSTSSEEDPEIADPEMTDADRATQREAAEAQRQTAEAINALQAELEIIEDELHEHKDGARDRRSEFRQQHAERIEEYDVKWLDRSFKLHAARKAAKEKLREAMAEAKRQFPEDYPDPYIPSDNGSSEAQSAIDNQDHHFIDRYLEEVVSIRDGEMHPPWVKPDGAEVDIDDWDWKPNEGFDAISTYNQLTDRPSDWQEAEQERAEQWMRDQAEASPPPEAQHQPDDEPREDALVGGPV